MSSDDGNPRPGGSVGSSAATTLKGAWQAVTGFGDYVRGNAMDFIDAITGSEAKHPETEVGERRMKEGLTRVKSATSMTGGRETEGAQPSTTGDAPPLPERRQDAGDTSTAASTGTEDDKHDA
ncbi:hypothetical protein OBBRIDRAFT_791964 [Obba rivulosa]|uniref:Uncharacterized protein n=1 Tax=Obba rivulosa TaxID=1052685 RepID=A0A8E2DM56_9APHY|nr:hypothetical protein OBBRIDRAFT_791964 [Obba rivulosa]